MNEPPRRLPGLTMLRGLAIGLVLVHHAFPVVGGGGIVGVVVFFTLSGYLITGLLVREVEREGRVSFGRFYRNRFLRLGPALLAVLTVFVVVELTTHRLGARGHVPDTVFLALTYLADFRFGPHISVGMSHLWTLAVEEQFYLVWPALLVLAVRWRRLTTLLVVAGALLMACCTVSLVLSTHVAKAYPLPTTWGITLVIGAAAAVHHRRLESVLSGPRGAGWAAVALAVLGALSMVQGAKEHWWTYIVGGPLIAAATVVLIVHVSRWEEATSWPWRALEGLGVVSYAAYLWNYLIVSWISGEHLVELGPAQGVLSIVATVLAAWLSWRLVESPVLRIRSRLDRPERPVAAPAGSRR